MSQAFRIETLDRSGRWYLTPGARSIYDLRVRNDSKNPVDCSLVVEDPVSGVTVEPASFALSGHEVRAVTVTFLRDASAVRTHRIALSLRSDDDGNVLATFEHPLVVAGSTDCSLAMTWKSAIVEAGELRGFEMTCTVRSQSEGPSTFQVAFAPHPAFKVPELPVLALEPGQAGEVVIPVRWDRCVKDDSGFNHPQILEASVPVSNGRRTHRLRWELIESKIEPFTKNRGVAAPPAAAAAKKSPAYATTAMPSALLLVLSGCEEPLRLPAPPNARPAALAASAPSEALELPLFSGVVAPSSQPSPTSGNGKHAQVVTPPGATQVAATSSAVAPSAPPAAPKLTPYAPAKSDVAELSAAPPAAGAAAPPPITVSAPAATRTPISSKMILGDRPTTGAAPRGRSMPPGVLIGGLAVAALVVAGVLFKPATTPQAPSTTPVAVVTPILAANAVAAQSPALARRHAVAKLKAAKPVVAAAAPAQQPAATVALAPTAQLAAGSPARLAPAPKPAARKAAPVAAQTGPLHPFRHIKLYQPESGSVVALGGIEAYYGPRGRAVRVLWSSAEQASASVQLIDDKGATINSVSVRGGRQSVILYLPRGYRGPLTVQVSSIGKLGERVAQTTSLPGFGN